MSFYGMPPSVGSKLIPRRNGPMPAIERTDTEKVRLAQRFLEARGYFVLPKLIGRHEVVEYLGCSATHLNNLLACDDFPKPFDIGSSKTSIDRTRTKPRWTVTDVAAWVESRKV